MSNTERRIDKEIVEAGLGTLGFTFTVNSHLIFSEYGVGLIVMTLGNVRHQFYLSQPHKKR